MEVASPFTKFPGEIQGQIFEDIRQILLSDIACSLKCERVCKEWHQQIYANKGYQQRKDMFYAHKLVKGLELIPHEIVAALGGFKSLCLAPSLDLGRIDDDRLNRTGSLSLESERIFLKEEEMLAPMMRGTFVINETICPFIALKLQLYRLDEMLTEENIVLFYNGKKFIHEGYFKFRADSCIYNLKESILQKLFLTQEHDDGWYRMRLVS